MISRRWRLPRRLHYKLGRKALEAGKHVYVEKPLALVAREAEELCLLAERKGLVLMVGHLLQYHPAFLKLKDMVLGGDLGEVRYIYSNRLSLGKFDGKRVVCGVLLRTISP